jgi:hypothetical protein
MWRRGEFESGRRLSSHSSEEQMHSQKLSPSRTTSLLTLLSNESSFGNSLSQGIILITFLFLFYFSFKSLTILIPFFRYFMRELVPKGAMEEGKVSIFLTTWVDKSSPLCMFTHAQFRAWSAPHLKSSCWYLDCAKGFCHEDEEDLKKSIDISSGTIDLTTAADAEDQQQEDEKEKKEKEKEREMARKNER